MRVHLRRLDVRTYECWVEVGFDVVAESKAVDVGGCLLITWIGTEIGHKRKGYASAIMARYRKHFDEVWPHGVLPSGRVFWDKHCPGWHKRADCNPDLPEEAFMGSGR